MRKPEKTIKDYELFEQVGESHTCKVYRAIHKATARIVSIKVIPPEILSKKIDSKRLHAEAEFYCPLKHCNILQCYDFFTDGESAYLVTEYVDGFNLRHCIVESERSFPDPRLRFNHLMDTGQRICEGLIYLHNQKIVHGQIKPENILVSREFVSPFLHVHKEVKIADFATAGPVKGFLRSSSRVKGGTLKYMAPEQVSRKRTTIQSDIFSLGVTLYELFTGRHPWNGNGSQKELLSKLLSPKHRPVPPSQLITSLPRQIDNVIMKMMEKKEKNRPSTMAEVWLGIHNVEIIRI